jgi:membrane protein DedA with SNARE-associated domain
VIDFFVNRGSYLAIIAILTLTGTGLPIPEELPIVTAGLLSAHGQMNPWLALAACLIGAISGDCVMYWIGRRFGRSVVREHPWYAHFVKPEREAEIEKMIEQHGLKVFLLARFLVGFRSPVYLTAGILRVSFRRFLLTDLFCASLVIGLFFGLSFFFGEAITTLIHDAEIGVTVVVLAALAVGGFYLWRRHRKKQSRRNEPETAEVKEGLSPPRHLAETAEEPADITQAV